ncbi:MAG TPA: DUF6161 domain-containing protein [Azospirillaceae bacterium]|nr:DUF6161 domain-containing protein [Azospirillaceae bacterium]
MEKPKSPESFPLLLTNDDGSNIAFETEEKLWAWFKEQRILINKLSSSSEFNHCFKDAIRQFLEIEPTDNYDSILSKLKLCSNSGMVFIGTEKGRFISRLLSFTKPSAAVYAAGIISGKISPTQINMNNQEADLGRIAAVAFLAVGDPLGDREKIYAAIKESKKSSKNIFGLLRKFEQLYDKAEKDWDEKVSTFVMKAALSAPTEYWKQRREHHKNLAVKSRRAWNMLLITETIGFMLLSPLILAGLPDWYATNIASFIGITEAHTPAIASPTPPLIGKLLQHTLILGTIAGLGIWLLRQELKKALSHEHLAEDAAERVTMVETFAALQAAGLAGGEFGPILNALYRPAATGLIADDGPVTPLEVILRETIKKADSKPG